MRAAAVRVTARAVAGVGRKEGGDVGGGDGVGAGGGLGDVPHREGKKQQDRCGCECVALRFLRLYLPTHGPVSWLMLETRN